MIAVGAAAKGAVQTAKGGEIATGIWTLVGIAVAAVFGAIGVWMKQRGGWRKAEVDAETQLRSEMWKDIQALKLSKEENSRRLTIAETRIGQQASEIGQLRFLLGLMNRELERVSPGNTIAREVRILMQELQRQATMSGAAEETGAMAELMSKLCAPEEEKPDARP